MSDRFDHTFDHKLERKPDGPHDAALDVRRIELITGTGRRRRWAPDVKARILLESLEPGVNISEVARRHGLTPQQLFGWRHQAQVLNSGSAGAPAQSLPIAPASQRRPKVMSRKFSKFIEGPERG
jgi:transposase